jgi:hypothetical protein
MLMDYGAFDTALKAAVGDDASLMAELRVSFASSARLYAISIISLRNEWRIFVDFDWQKTSNLHI